VRSYFNPKTQLCKTGAPASSDFDIASLLKGYQLCAITKGKSPRTIAAITLIVRLFYQFLQATGQSTEVTHVGPPQIRAFIFSLGQKQAFSGHRFTHPQPHGLSTHTVQT
jgi:hypothetical protein